MAKDGVAKHDLPGPDSASPDVAHPVALPLGTELAVLDAADRVVAGHDTTRFFYALTVAIVAHLLTFGAATGAFDGLIPEFLAPPSAQDAGASAPKPFGDEKGAIDGVAAEVIDADEFDKKYISFKPGRDVADMEPAEQASKQTPVKPEPDPAEVESPVDKGPGDDPLPAKKPPEKPKQAQPQKPQKPAESVLSEADIAELLADSSRDIQGGVTATSRAGEAAQGTASPYVRGVIRLLKQNMPKLPRVRGKVTVQLVVGLSGELEGVRVFESSGRPDLDRMVIESIIATRFPKPTKETTPRERMFQISYDYN